MLTQILLGVASGGSILNLLVLLFKNGPLVKTAAKEVGDVVRGFGDGKFDPMGQYREMKEAAAALDAVLTRLGHPDVIPNLPATAPAAFSARLQAQAADPFSPSVIDAIARNVADRLAAPRSSS